MELNITEKAAKQLKDMLQEQEQFDKKFRIVMTGIS